MLGLKLNHVDKRAEMALYTLLYNTLRPELKPVISYEPKISFGTHIHKLFLYRWYFPIVFGSSYQFYELGLDPFSTYKLMPK